MCSWPEHLAHVSPMNRIARGCASKSVAFVQRFERWRP
jgi:hypothetical protein